MVLKYEMGERASARDRITGWMQCCGKDIGLSNKLTHLMIQDAAEST